MESFYYKAKDEGRRERNLQTAQKMLKKGLSLDLICEITELPRETVERLGKEIAN